jgi:hypothetical protein
MCGWLCLLTGRMGLACLFCFVSFVLYGSWPTVHSATRLSSASAYGRLLPLDAATLNAPPASSCDVVAINRRAQTLFDALALGVYGVAASRSNCVQSQAVFE